MTEREYVETLKAAAEAYREVARSHPLPATAHADIERWERLKGNLAPSTLVRLAEAWLGREVSGTIEGGLGR